MATKRGPKVEPKEINKYKVVVSDLPEKPKALVFEDEPIIEEKLMTEEEIVAQEEFINETGETPEEIKESLEKLHNLDADKEFEEVINNAHFQFQEEYKLTHNGKDAVIDALPQPQKRKKRPEELNQSELRMFHKTGFLPEI